MNPTSLIEIIRPLMRLEAPFWHSLCAQRRTLMSPCRCQSIWENSISRTLLTFRTKTPLSNMSLQWKISYNITFLMALESLQMKNNLLNLKREKSFFLSLNRLSTLILPLKGSQSPPMEYFFARESASGCLRWAPPSL